MIVPPIFPLAQRHEMTSAMQEDIKPKRRKRKHGGAVPGYRQGGRADRRPPQAGGMIYETLGIVPQPDPLPPEGTEKRRGGAAWRR
jgi:hypothetical protein